MKKYLITLTLMCSTALNTNAQIYSGDAWTKLPTTDLYDVGLMNMHVRLLAETAAKRKAKYDRCCELAIEAYKNKKWDHAIGYVNEALSTQYYSGQLYYIRGYAYEQLGNLKQAKRDYKKGKKYNSTEAAQALEALKKKR